MKWHERAILLLHKSSQDEYILDKLLHDPQAPIEIFGFHAQQAAEKMLKAALSSLQIIYPRTHRIVELIDLLHDAAVPFPESLEELRTLTPYAVEFRYDSLPEESEGPLDQSRVRELLRQLRRWAESCQRADDDRV